MSTADIQAAKERLTAHVQAFTETEPRSRHLDDVNSLLAELSRLEGALRYEQHLAGRIGTHGPGCEVWGPQHYECSQAALAAARRQIQELREGLKPLAEVAHVKLCGVWRDDEHIWHTDAASHITFGQARRAASLLAPGEGKGEDLEAGTGAVAKKTMTLTLTDAEMAVLEEIAKAKDMTPRTVFRHAMKLFQLEARGLASVKIEGGPLSSHEQGEGA